MPGPRLHLLALAAGVLLALVYRVAWEPRPAGGEDMLTLGLVLGSERPAGNTRGVGSFVAETIRALPPLELAAPPGASDPRPNTIQHSSPGLILDVVDLAALALPRTFEHAPRRVPRNVSARSTRWCPAEYDRATCAWSTRVRRWDALLIVTPEYNGAIPGLLKSALDRLYWEWGGLPAALVTLGGKGGVRAMLGAQLIMDELGTEVLEGVQVVLRGARVMGDEGWLGEEYGVQVGIVVRRLLETAARRRRAAAEGGVPVDADIGGVEMEDEEEVVAQGDEKTLA